MRGDLMVRYMVRARRCAKYAAIRMCIAATPYGVGDEVTPDCTGDEVMSGPAPGKDVPKEFSRSMPAIHTPAKATTDHSMEFRISLDPVAPMNIPSQVNAAHPTTGISRSHGRKSLEASTTTASEVIILSRGTPAKWYIPINITAIPMLHTKVHFTVFTSLGLSFAPMYLPVIASPAYANPSVK